MLSLNSFERHQCQNRFNTKPGTSERHRIQLLSQPSFVLKESLDSSRLFADGSLERSHRMARLEAVLLIAGVPLSDRKLAQAAHLIDVQEVRQMIERLNESYDRTRSAFRIENTAAGSQLMTRPQLAEWLDRLHQRQSQMKLSQPAMETLTIIAYQQPVTRADVEAVRGVQSTDMIRQLIDRGLIRVGGEEDSLGRPFLYETTRQFLSMFGLRRIEDLPDYETLAPKPTSQTAPHDSRGTEESRPEESDSVQLAASSNPIQSDS